ncbi:MAG: calcium/sodium antiporter [Patescibacteria group bacterium]|nr:calcium/sodium antiporter [Patescibacteria group bacterium]
MDFLYLTLGIAGLGISAHFIVRGVKNIAKFFKISELFIGLTVISIGTSLPEISVNIVSALNKLNGIDSSGIAVGNVIGSAINQFTIIIGILAVIHYVVVSKRSIKRDGLVLLGVIVVVFIMALDLNVSRLEGALLIIFYLFYLFSLKGECNVFKKLRGRRPKGELLWDFLFLVGGLMLISFSSKMVVESAILISHGFQISESIIGLLVVGLGTGLPELTIALFAVLKKSYRLAIGNLIGSNICDLMLSLGIGSVISGFTVDRQILQFDIPFLFFLSIVVLLFLRSKYRLEKKEGVALLVIYLFYVGFKLIFHM